MYKKEVVEHFGHQYKVAEKLGISSVAVSRWGAVIPEKQALKLARLTRGRLKYDPELYSE